MADPRRFCPRIGARRIGPLPGLEGNAVKAWQCTVVFSADTPALAKQHAEFIGNQAPWAVVSEPTKMGSGSVPVSTVSSQPRVGCLTLFLVAFAAMCLLAFMAVCSSVRHRVPEPEKPKVVREADWCGETVWP